MAYVDQIFAELNPQQRAAATRLHAPVAIAAGAGSGKTKTMIARIAALVSPWRPAENEDDPLVYEAPIDSLCVITFTNKAAKEINERLKPVFDEITASGKRVPELAIGTFHSVSMRLLRRYANAAGMPANFTVADEADAAMALGDALRPRLEHVFAYARLADAAIRETVEGRLSPDDRKAFATWLGLAVGADGAPHAHQDLVTEHLARTLIGFAPPQDLEAVVTRRFIGRVGSEIEAAKNKMMDAVDAAGGVDGTPGLFRSPRRLLEEISAPDDDVHARLQRLAGAFPGLEAFADALVDGETPSITIGEIGVESFAAYERRMSEARTLDFADLLNTLTRVIRDNPEIAANVRAVYRHFIVDEAQDMNPAQLEWLRAMTGDGAPISDQAYEDMERLRPRLRAWPFPSIALCGDQDQAIYGFRGSKPNLFTRVFAGIMQDAGQDVETLKIETNYRCNPLILALANASISLSEDSDRIAKILKPYDKAPLALKPRYFQVSEHVVVSRGQGAARGVAIEGALTSNRFHPPRRQGRLAAALEMTREAGETMAVLVRTRAQARAVHRELAGLGVPAELAGGADFHDGKAYKDMLSYGRLAFNPFDDSAFRRIRNNPARGLGDGSMKKLDAFARKEELSSIAVAVALARQAGGLIDEDGMGDNKIDVPSDLVSDRTKARLRDFFTTMAAAREAVLKRNEPEGGAKALLALLERVGWAEKARDDVESDRALRGALAEAEPFKSLEDWLQSASLDAVSTLDEEAAAARPPVVVSTIHAAKGLEWDHVLVVGCVDGMIPFAAEKKNDFETDASDDPEEERRLFFVAATRARKTLNFSGPSNVEDCVYLREVFQKGLVGLGPRLRIPDSVIRFESPEMIAAREAARRAPDQDAYKLEMERLEAAIAKQDFKEVRKTVIVDQLPILAKRARQEPDDRDAVERLTTMVLRMLPSAKPEMAFGQACKILKIDPAHPAMTAPRKPAPDPVLSAARPATIEQPAAAELQPAAAELQPEWAPYEGDPHEAGEPAYDPAPF